MNNLKKSIDQEFAKWKNSPPNLVQRGTGFLFKPVEILIKPFIKIITPLFEGVLKGLNHFIASAIKETSNEILDIDNMSENEFEAWLKKQDSVSRKQISVGIALITAEGAATGLGGATLLAVDIPASFGLILGFANKIALTYQLDITDENVQVEIMKAISAGSETSVEGKASAVATLKTTANIINKQTWKSMGTATKGTIPHFIITIRAFLKKLGVNVTKRKAAQLIPVLGAVSGGVINGSWAADALEAVRQYARKSTSDLYFEKENTIQI